jgi:tryptophanyl-tRNA synthetase
MSDAIPISVSGMRPTGLLHLGHYEGVIRSWLDLQHRARCHFFVADLHALTDRWSPEELTRWSLEMVKDWLALGIDPERAVIFVQSQVPAHAELATLLGMVTPVSWLERCPTYKDRIAELGKGSENHGLLSYPVLQAADIALYDAELVPVGEDQVAHLELAREIVRRFNATFPGANLVEPQPVLTRVAKAMGLDGRKMSKSFGNAIELSAAPATIAELIMKRMKTDEARQRRSDPGDPARCNLYPWQEIHSPERTEEIRRGCTSAELGCVDCKKILIAGLERHFADYRARRAALDDVAVRRILEDGRARATEAAARVMARVRSAVGLMRGSS